MKTRDWTDAERRQAREMHRAGASGSLIASTLNRTEAGVWRVIRVRPQGQVDALLRLCWTTHPVETIARSLGITRPAALARAAAIGLDPDAQFVAPPKAPEPPKPQPTPKHRFSREQIAAALECQTPEGAILRRQIMAEVFGKAA